MNLSTSVRLLRLAASVAKMRMATTGHRGGMTNIYARSRRWTRASACAAPAGSPHRSLLSAGSLATDAGEDRLNLLCQSFQVVGLRGFEGLLC